jgi:hypothetical protein
MSIHETVTALRNYKYYKAGITMKQSTKREHNDIYYKLRIQK